MDSIGTMLIRTFSIICWDVYLDRMPSLFMHDERMEFGGHPNTTSVAIPIANARHINQSNLSGSNDGDDLSSPSFHNATSAEILMGGHGTNYITTTTNAHQPYVGHVDVPRSMSYAPKSHHVEGPHAYGAAMGYVGSLPHDPYPSPVVRNGTINLPAAMRATGLHHAPDNLSMLYGQSCPESSFQTQSIPGLKQMKFPVDMSTSPMNMLFPQFNSRDVVTPTSTNSHNAANLNNSMFQFRATNPASAEQIIEKQKKRKESHNAVERRRRDHINEMIHQLGLIVDDGDGESIRLNKGEILQRAVERIRFLEQVVQVQRDHLAIVDPTFELPQIVIQPAAAPHD